MNKYSGLSLKFHSVLQNSNNNDLLLRYIWLDGNGYDLRTKSIRTETEPKSVDEVPLWTYCGQTCGHMKLTENSECWLKPVLLCNDPFRQSKNKLVFCVPIKYQIEASIYRHSCESALNKLNDSEIPALTIRQSYFIVNAITKRPIGWPYDDFNKPNPMYNYGVGSNAVIGRDINEAFYKACLYSGLPLISTQVEDMPSMWSFEIGPTYGTAIADQLWMARYLLHYIGEEFNYLISFESLKHNQSVSQCMKVWSEDQSIGQTFAMITDPYIAIKTIYQSIG